MIRRARTHSLPAGKLSLRSIRPQRRYENVADDVVTGPYVRRAVSRCQYPQTSQKEGVASLRRSRRASLLLCACAV